MGESIFVNEKDNLKINGITISPKKNFCIIKIWLNTCEYQDLKGLNESLDLQNETFIFKKNLSK